jgi:hypothetical protein
MIDKEIETTVDEVTDTPQEEETISVFVMVRGGMVTSILGSRNDMSIEVIDEDIAEIDPEVASTNQELRDQMEEMQQSSDLYEYCPAAQEVSPKEEE